jgi:hypothetical protein
MKKLVKSSESKNVSVGLQVSDVDVDGSPRTFPPFCECLEKIYSSDCINWTSEFWEKGDDCTRYLGVRLKRSIYHEPSDSWEIYVIRSINNQGKLSHKNKPYNEVLELARMRLKNQIADMTDEAYHRTLRSAKTCRSFERTEQLINILIEESKLFQTDDTKEEEERKSREFLANMLAEED